MCIRDAINIQGQPEPYLKTICLPHLVTFVSERKQSLVSLEGCLSKCHINLHNALVVFSGCSRAKELVSRFVYVNPQIIHDKNFPICSQTNYLSLNRLFKLNSNWME